MTSRIFYYYKLSNKCEKLDNYDRNEDLLNEWGFVITTNYFIKFNNTYLKNNILPDNLRKFVKEYGKAIQFTEN